MKTGMLGLLCSLLTVAVWAAPTIDAPLAASPLKLMTSQANDGDMVVQLVNMQTKDTDITFTNLAAKEIYYQNKVSDHNGFAAELVLDQAPDGRYLLEVKQDDVTLTQVILKERGLILFSKIVKKES